MVYKKGHVPWNKNKHLSEEHKRNMSISKIEYLKTHTHPCVGRKLTQEHKDIISKANTGRVYTEERNKKISEALKARHRKQIAERRSNGLKKYYKTHTTPNLGVPHTEETRRKISTAMKEWWKSKKEE